MDTRTATIALNMLPKIGPVRVRKLLEHFGTPADILGAPVGDLQRASGIGAETAKIIHNWREHVDPESEMALAEERGISILLREDSNFPEPLRTLYDCPLLLYVWGELEPQDADSIAVVGTRRCTHYGLQTTKKLAYQLANAGLTIISGLARGIDTAAHEGALAADGRTIGVIGSGLGQLYPPENLGLAQKIADGHGAIVTEFAMNQAPDRKTFPQRNRIVAGWCRGLLVTESPSRSGSLITADMAGKNGKTLYAVPGQIDRPTSGGCHDLIRDGAQLITDGGQILEDLSMLRLDTPAPQKNAGEKKEPVLDLTPTERLIYDELSSSEVTIDTLVDQTGLGAHEISPALLGMELKGLVKSLPGSLYVRG